MTNLTAFAEQIATHYWGKPTSRKGTELRWGSHGSKSLCTKRGIWFDFEGNEGGGLIQMVKNHEGATLTSIPDLLERKFGIPKASQNALSPAKYLAAKYDYYDADGVLAYQVQRFEPKTFLQRQPDGKGGWINNMKGVEAVPYNLQNIIKNPNKTIFIVEGEKCADKLIGRGAVATTNHGGAANWKPELNKYFKGRKVVVIPDADEAGQKHAAVVIKNLMPVAKEIKRVDLPGLTNKQDVYDWFNSGGTTNDLRDLVRDADPITETPDVPDDTKFKLLSIADLKNMPPVKWLINDVITSHGLSVLYGAPGVGKSFIAIDMALSIAYGRDWHDKTVDGGLVLYIAGEGVGGLGKRVKAWQSHYNLEDDAPFLVLPLAVQFREQADIDKLIETISAIEGKIKCVVIDTVARSMVGMEENSSTEIGIFVSACDSIKQMFDCAVLAIHHSGKDASRGMRGSNALLGAVDTSLMLKKSGDNIVLNTEKQKDAEPIDDMAFALEQVALIGETSAVVKRVEKKVEQKKEKALNENEIELHNLMVELLDRYNTNSISEKVLNREHRLLWKGNGKEEYYSQPSKERTDTREAMNGYYLKKEKDKWIIIRDLDGNLTPQDLF